ncbi:hypothetical protein BC834DRAFT_966987 [Gloeopeniophorella convolvens]|nr:hypothetical protein BC834DRAFT_966987 [Gloeopeniophorella convolvens]
MLKRQRPSSPLPAQAVVPDFPIISPDPTSSEHIAKRRRTEAPSLDGPSRGWGPSPGFSEDEDEGFAMDGGDLHDRLHMHTQRLEGAGEYKTANTLLRDLHVEQQHRRLLSTSSSPDPSYHSWSSHNFEESPVRKYATVTNPYQLHAEVTPLYKNYYCQATLTNSMADMSHTNEGSGVYEHYEGANRFLRSIFLERRRDTLSTDS